MTRNEYIERSLESGRLNAWAISLEVVERPEPRPRPVAIVRWLTVRLRRWTRGKHARRPKPRPPRPTPAWAEPAVSAGAD